MQERAIKAAMQSRSQSNLAPFLTEQKSPTIPYSTAKRGACARREANRHIVGCRQPSWHRMRTVIVVFLPLLIPPGFNEFNYRPCCAKTQQSCRTGQSNTANQQIVKNKPENHLSYSCSSVDGKPTETIKCGGCLSNFVSVPNCFCIYKFIPKMSARNKASRCRNPAGPTILRTFYWNITI
jgi:hypothetical protein